MDATPSVLDLINREIAAKTAERRDPVGEMVHRVLVAGDPDAVFRALAEPVLRNFAQETRRLKITMLAMAFGVERAALKKYLRAYSLCGPAD